MKKVMLAAVLLVTVFGGVVYQQIATPVIHLASYDGGGPPLVIGLKK